MSLLDKRPIGLIVGKAPAISPDSPGQRKNKLNALSQYPELRSSTGVYAFFDACGRVLYVGQCVAGIRQNGITGRIQRHLTCARSDLISKRKIWPTEIVGSYLFLYDSQNKKEMDILEAHVYNRYVTNGHVLMNTQVPKATGVVPQFSELCVDFSPHEERQYMRTVEFQKDFQKKMLEDASRFYEEIDPSEAMEKVVKIRTNFLKEAYSCAI